MAQKKQPIERRIYPSHPVTLELEEGKTATFNLTFNFDAIIRVEQKTGLKLLEKSILSEMLSLTVLSAAFWGSACENHPEYETDEGLRALRSLLNDQDNLEKVSVALWESYLLCLPKKRREALIKAKEEADRREREGLEPVEDPTNPSRTTKSLTEAPTGSGSQPSLDSTSESAFANSAS